MVKTLKNLLLKNQKANELGTWYVAFGMWVYQVCSNDDYKLILTYLSQGQVRFLMHLNGNFYEKLFV